MEKTHNKKDILITKETQQRIFDFFLSTSAPRIYKERKENKK